MCVSPCVRMFKPLEKPIKAYSLNQHWICRITYEVLAESYRAAEKSCGRRTEGAEWAPSLLTFSPGGPIGP